MGLKTSGIRYDAWRERLDPVLEVFFLARFGLLMSVVASVLIAWPPQSIDAVRVLAEDARAHWFQMICFWLVAPGLCLFLWGSVRVMFRLRLPPPEQRAPLILLASKHVPRVLAVLPLLAIVIACTRANIAVEDRQTSVVLWGFAIVSAVAALLSYVVLSASEPWLHANWDRPPALRKPFLWPVHLARLGLKVAVPVALAALLVFTIDSQLARHLGPLTVLLLALIIWTTFGTALVYLGTRARLPLLLGLLVLLVAWSSLDWNDNHAVRSLPTAPGDRVELPDMSDAFARWLDARADKDEYEVYPVFIVSAEGGGLYAAYFTAIALSVLQDADPAFARHVFAISGVSGGSLGASVFAALASQAASNRSRAEDRRDVSFEDAAGSILSRDFLSPLLAAALFPDALQRFVPLSVPGVSRARALEHGFESAWAAEAETHEEWDTAVFSHGFYELWSDFATGATPALLLNATEVETGQRMVIANLHPDDRLYSESPMRAERDAAIRTLADISGTLDPPLSTAVSMSARFPILTPAGSINASRKHRVVDGGYFDNSGATTLADVLISMHAVEHEDHHAYRVVWIHIGFLGEKSQERKTGLLDTRQGLGELMSPLRALLNTRSGRTGTSIRQLRILGEQLEEHGGDVEKVEFLLKISGSDPPLGWLLSEGSRRRIRAQLDDPENLNSTNQILQLLRDPAGGPATGAASTG